MSATEYFDWTPNTDWRVRFAVSDAECCDLVVSKVSYLIGESIPNHHEFRLTLRCSLEEYNFLEQHRWFSIPVDARRWYGVEFSPSEAILVSVGFRDLSEVYADSLVVGDVEQMLKSLEANAVLLINKLTEPGLITSPLFYDFTEVKQQLGDTLILFSHDESSLLQPST